MAQTLQEVSVTRAIFRQPTRIVVDLGCVDRPEFNACGSLEALAERYKPDIIYGFDPSPTLDTTITEVAGVPVVLERKAAWLYDGEINFDDEWIRGRVGAIGVAPPTAVSTGRIGTIGEGTLTAECFDFSPWLAEHGPAVVKMDIEGAEYGLLDRMLDDGTDRLISELLIEWHDQPDERIIERLTCPIVDWWM